MLGFAAGLAVATCLLFGLAPALRGTRIAAASVMRATARGATAGKDSILLRRGLVVLQIALSVALLFGSLLFARTLYNVLIVDHGSLYPALQRLEERGFIDADWGTSENNRKARFYTLTRAGRKELVREESEWRRIAAAIMRVLEPKEVGG